METERITRRTAVYALLDNGSLEYVRYNPLKGISTTIPATIKGTPVVAIRARAFSWRFTLHDVYISNGISSIGNSAFACCAHLKKVFIPDSVTFIGKYAFDVCPQLTITVGQGSYAEWYCKENKLRYVCRNNSRL